MWVCFLSWQSLFTLQKIPFAINSKNCDFAVILLLAFVVLPKHIANSFTLCVYMCVYLPTCSIQDLRLHSCGIVFVSTFVIFPLVVVHSLPSWLQFSILFPISTLLWVLRVWEDHITSAYSSFGITIIQKVKSHSYIS